MSTAALPPFVVDAGSASVAVGSTLVGLSWAGLTHPGSLRATNQDCFRIRNGVFVVCDGMGGHRGGARASELAADAILVISRDGTAPDVRDVVTAVRRANDLVLADGNADPNLFGMGTTAVVLAAVDNGGRGALVAVNVGDSRIYLLADGALTQVSKDHSVVQELLDAGLISPVEAMTHRERHVVTRVLGSDPPPDVDAWILDPVPGSRYLLCSDGVHGEVDPGALDDLLRRQHPQDVVLGLADAAMRAGARDNITAVVVDVVSRRDEPDETFVDTMPRHALNVPDATQGVREVSGA